MTDEPIARELAEYARGLTYDALDDGAIETAKARIVDALACAVAARGEAPVDRIAGYAATTGGDRTARVLGTDRTAAVDAATLANGTAIRYLDWNDTYLSAEPGHPSDNLGAVLSVADAHGRSGRDVLAATVLAYEVHCRLCDAASLRSRGFDHVNYGLVSSSLAAGWLMDLSADELEQAVNVAVNGHVALRQARAGELTEWKGVAFANAARNAVVAAGLAATGIRGPTPVFEGRFGFFEQVSGPFDLDVSAFGGNGGGFRITGTHLKRYPVEYHVQGGVECALSLRPSLDPGSVERIRHEAYEEAVAITADEPEKWDPRTRETADHSTPYCIARTIENGRLGLSAFDDAAVRDPGLRPLMDRIEVEENPAFTDAYPDRLCHRMTVETGDGTYETSIDYPPDHARNPLSRDELVGKFVAAADGSLPPDRVREAVEWVDGLDDRESIDGLFGLVRPDAG